MISLKKKKSTSLLKNANHHLTMPSCHKPSICEKKKKKRSKVKHNEMRYVCRPLLLSQSIIVLGIAKIYV